MNARKRIEVQMEYFSQNELSTFDQLINRKWFEGYLLCAFENSLINQEEFDSGMSDLKEFLSI